MGNLKINFNIKRNITRVVSFNYICIYLYYVVYYCRVWEKDILRLFSNSKLSI